MRNIIIKKKCLLFKHEKNNQTLSNDWLTYCHKGIWKGSVLSFLKDKVEWKMSDTGSAHWASSFLLNCIKYLPILSKTKKNLWTQNLIFWMKAHCPDPQGLVTIQVNILSMTMYKHIQGRTSFFTPARFKSCLFFKFILIYSKPCLVQLPRPYSFQKISWPPLDYFLWRRSGRFCQEFAWVENNMDPKWK